MTDKLIAGCFAMSSDGKICKIMVNSFLLNLIFIKALLKVNYLAIAAAPVASSQKRLNISQIND